MAWLGSTECPNRQKGRRGQRVASPWSLATQNAMQKRRATPNLKTRASRFVDERTRRSVGRRSVAAPRRWCQCFTGLGGTGAHPARLSPRDGMRPCRSKTHPLNRETLCKRTGTACRKRFLYMHLGDVPLVQRAMLVAHPLRHREKEHSRPVSVASSTFHGPLYQVCTSFVYCKGLDCECNMKGI